jgi:hypothetical protein
MPLNIHQLEKARRSGNGVVIARCPACAAAGQDHQGNHLKVYPDGRFGCVLFPGKEGRLHRQHIFQLVGDRDGTRPPLKLTYSLKLT